MAGSQPRASQPEGRPHSAELLGQRRLGSACVLFDRRDLGLSGDDRLVHVVDGLRRTTHGLKTDRHTHDPLLHRRVALLRGSGRQVLGGAQPFESSRVERSAPREPDVDPPPEPRGHRDGDEQKEHREPHLDCHVDGLNALGIRCVHDHAARVRAGPRRVRQRQPKLGTRARIERDRLVLRHELDAGRLAGRRLELGAGCAEAPNRCHVRGLADRYRKTSVRSEGGPRLGDERHRRRGVENGVDRAHHHDGQRRRRRRVGRRAIRGDPWRSGIRTERQRHDERNRVAPGRRTPVLQRADHQVFVDCRIRRGHLVPSERPAHRLASAVARRDVARADGQWRTRGGESQFEGGARAVGYDEATRS